MSNKINLPTVQIKNESKNETSQNNEKEKCFLEDIQLLSSLKSIPGKTIPLYNKINEASKNNNKDNNKDQSYINETNNKINNKSKSIFSPIEKSIFNNFNNTINNMNNNYTTNNFYINNGVNNANININFNSLYSPPGAIQLLPDQFTFLDNPILFPPSNHPSFLSIKSNIKNNIIPTENNFTQNSLYFQNMIYNGNSTNQNDFSNNKGNISKNIYNNNINNKFSQLSFQQYNIGKEELLKKKRPTNLFYRKDSENNLENNNNLFNNNTNIKKSVFIYNKNNDKLRKENKNIINIKEEKKERIENEKKIYDNKDKKVLFNVENYSEESYEEEIYNIYHNKNKFESNNLFNCYLKKKKRKRKINEIKRFKCIHPNCDYSYKTLKQLQNHHYKMISECQLDSVQILKLIYNTKLILLKLITNDKNKKEYFSKLYENSVKNINLRNYSESITGMHIDDLF